jgi:hypothetical protein
VWLAVLLWSTVLVWLVGDGRGRAAAGAGGQGAAGGRAWATAEAKRCLEEVAEVERAEVERRLR